MSKMIIIGEALVSEELVNLGFCCNLSKCLGQCCVEGDAGAPLEKEEIRLLEDHLDTIKEFLSIESADLIQRKGVFETDVQEKFVTPLLNGKECVFTRFKDNIAQCAIEMAWNAGKISFRKPVSCHLYPVRISKFKGCTAVNIHKWHVCSDAWKEGKEKTIPVYIFLKDALIRNFGEEWYRQLECAAAIKKQ
jgi:hypothetical protein